MVKGANPATLAGRGITVPLWELALVVPAQVGSGGGGGCFWGKIFPFLFADRGAAGTAFQ